MWRTVSNMEPVSGNSGRISCYQVIFAFQFSLFFANLFLTSGSYKPLPYSGIKKCKWKNCNEIYVDAVDALKHIKDTHLKTCPKQKTKTNQQNLKRKVENADLQSNEINKYTRH